MLFIENWTAAGNGAGGRPLHRWGQIMNFTYMVKCADGTFYTGWTNCLERRLKAHNEGKDGAKYTKAKRPVELIYYEGFATKEEAMQREYRIKKLSRREKERLLEF